MFAVNCYVGRESDRQSVLLQRQDGTPKRCSSLVMSRCINTRFAQHVLHLDMVIKVVVKYMGIILYLNYVHKVNFVDISF